MSPEDATTITPATVAAPGRFMLNGFAVRKVVFEEVARVSTEEGEERPARIPTGIHINTAIQMNIESLRAVITLDVEVSPDPKWQPYRISVRLAGAFAAENVTAEQFDQFCRNSVPPILFPYVREIVHRVTIDGAHGLVKIDPINVSELIAKSPWKEQP